MGIVERRENEKKTMKQKILDAAMNLFISEGYENVSIRKIASKIEYSPGTIYLYFKDKSDIIYELHEIGFGKFFERQMSIQNVEDSFKRLEEHMRAYLHFAFEFPEYYQMMFIEKAPVKTICEKAEWTCGGRSFELLIKNVTQCQEDGYFKGRNPLEVSFFLWSLVHGFAALEICQRLDTLKYHGFSVDTTIETMVKLLDIFKIKE